MRAALSRLWALACLVAHFVIWIVGIWAVLHGDYPKGCAFLLMDISITLGLMLAFARKFRVPPALSSILQAAFRGSQR